MNLYFRLLIVLIKNLFRKKFVSYQTETKINFHVLPNDLDTNMHMNNGRYLTLMDLGRLDFMGKTGLLKIALKKKWFPVLGATQMIYLKSLKPFQKYTLRTTLECWDEKWFVMKQCFEVNGKTYAQGFIKGLIRNKKNNIPPKEVLTAAGYPQAESPAASPAIRTWLTALEQQINKRIH